MFWHKPSSRGLPIYHKVHRPTPIDLCKTNGHSRPLKTRDLGCHYDLRTILAERSHLPFPAVGEAIGARGTSG